MLSESFIAASLSASENVPASSAHLKDAGIFIHSFQPKSSLVSTLKKSSVNQNCLAVSDGYIFAAQAHKALLHVYNRLNGKHEMTAYFNSRIHSAMLLCDQSILALGGEDGSVTLWELCTGRMKATSPSHLQAVSALTVDVKSNFLLSGSRDSNIHVWSLVDLLSFYSDSDNMTVNLDDIQPRRSLSGHRDMITSLVTSHSATTADIVLSASQDKTVILWNYKFGHRLRTFLLHSTPLCLALDPAVRAFYVGLADGGVQFISFYNDREFEKGISSTTPDAALIEPHASTLKYADGTSGSANGSTSEIETLNSISTLSLALSYDTSVILSGHASGKIYAWSTSGNGSFSSSVAQYDGFAITNLHFLPPKGWAKKQLRSVKATKIVKPMLHEAFSGSRGHLTKSYLSTVRIPHSLGHLRQRKSGRRKSPLSEDNSITDDEDHLVNDSSNSKAFTANEDFISIDVGVDVEDNAPRPSESNEQMTKEISALQKQIVHLKKIAVANSKHIDDLFEENEILRHASQGQNGAHQIGPNESGFLGSLNSYRANRNRDSRYASVMSKDYDFTAKDSPQNHFDENEVEREEQQSNFSTTEMEGLVGSRPLEEAVQESEENDHYESDDSSFRVRRKIPDKYVIL